MDEQACYKKSQTFALDKQGKKMSFFNFIFDEESVNFLFNNVEPFVLGVATVNSKKDLPCGFQYCEFVKNGTRYQAIRCTFKVFGKRTKLEMAYKRNGTDFNGGKDAVLSSLKVKVLRVVVRKISENARKPKADNTSTLHSNLTNKKLKRLVELHIPSKNSKYYRDKTVKRVLRAFSWILQHKHGLCGESIKAYPTAKEFVNTITHEDIKLYWHEISGLTCGCKKDHLNSLKRFYKHFNSSFIVPELGFAIDSLKPETEKR